MKINFNWKPYKGRSSHFQLIVTTNTKRFTVWQSNENTVAATFYNFEIIITFRNCCNSTVRGSTYYCKITLSHTEHTHILHNPINLSKIRYNEMKRRHCLHFILRSQCYINGVFQFQEFNKINCTYCVLIHQIRKYSPNRNSLTVLLQNSSLHWHHFRVVEIKKIFMKL